MKSELCNPFGVKIHCHCEPRVRRCAATLGYGVERLRRLILGYGIRRLRRLAPLFAMMCAAIIGTILPVWCVADDSLVAREEADLRAAVESVAESVVQIRTIGGLDLLSGALSAGGPTTGLVISADGYIVSSAFNFVEPPASIVVTLASGKQVPAELVATDHSRMLVLLKAPGAAGLPVPTLAPADEVRPGQWAIAVGRTFRADRTNVSVGIVSAVGRMFGKAIQTDADVSMANYGGPLVDIRGRVLGLIVPMAPQATSEVAGVEWYDSGIGFAVPLASIADRLEQMKRGEDQRPGILGIGMLPKNPHAAPAELATVRPDSPAGQAGLKKGDRIIEVDGKPVRTQTDLRFALGPRYGGDSVRVVAKRGDERLERTIMLAGELSAFRHAYLGILPMRTASEDSAEDDGADDDVRDGAENGLVVRMVCDGSPAAEAGVRPGDRILQIDETDIQSIDDALQSLNNVAPGNEVALTLHRAGDDEPDELTLTAARTPASVPNELPPAYDDGAAGGLVAAATEPPVATPGETSELKLPEFPHQCKVYVPASHSAGRPQAVLLWLHAPDKADADEVIRQWRPICDRDGILLVVPTAAETGRWEPTELEYLRRLVERVVAQHKIDRHRVVVFGQDGGGAMAWLLGLSGRDVFRGIAASAAPLPRQIRVPQNEPTQRLAIFAAIPPGKDAAAVQIAEGLQELSDAGYTVTTVTTANASDGLSDAQRAELARWIDTLDRF
jgi:serine protease Do